MGTPGFLNTHYITLRHFASLRWKQVERDDTDTGATWIGVEITDFPSRLRLHRDSAEYMRMTWIGYQQVTVVQPPHSPNTMLLAKAWVITITTLNLKVAVMAIMKMTSRQGARQQQRSPHQPSSRGFESEQHLAAAAVAAAPVAVVPVTTPQSHSWTAWALLETTSITPSINPALCRLKTF